MAAYLVGVWCQLSPHVRDAICTLAYYNTRRSHMVRGHAQGHPLHFELSPGQAHESTQLVDLLDGADAVVTTGQGEPVAWPAALAGDKGYRADWIDVTLLNLEITPVIPSKASEDRTARSVEFDRDRYRQCNIVERLIGWLKECRRLFSRFEKTALNFGGMIKMAFIERSLKLNT